MGYEIAKSPGSQSAPGVGQTAPDAPRASNAIDRSALVPHEMTAEERSARVSEVAYRLAEARHFSPGFELDDWLAAEQEVDAPSLNLQGPIHD
jgi:hypothetical protein